MDTLMFPMIENTLHRFWELIYHTTEYLVEEIYPNFVEIKRIITHDNTFALYIKVKNNTLFDFVHTHRDKYVDTLK